MLNRSCSSDVHANAIAFCMQSMAVLSDYDNLIKNMCSVFLLFHIYLRNWIVIVECERPSSWQGCVVTAMLLGFIVEAQSLTAFSVSACQNTILVLFLYHCLVIIINLVRNLSPL